MNVVSLAKLFGWVFLAVGILGFVPGITSNGHLLGIFEVDTVHNIIHLVSGIVALAAAYSSAGYARLYFQVFGVVYALVMIIGFIQGDTVLGLVHINFADNILHLVIAAAALWIGFGMKSDDGGNAPMQQEQSPGMDNRGPQM